MGDRLARGVRQATQQREALDALRESNTQCVLMMRSGNTDGGTFEGCLSFVAEGKRDGESETLMLTPLAGSALAAEEDESDLDIALDRYQRVQGLLALPEGFEPHTVTLNVLEGNMVRASRSIKIGL